MDSVVVSSSPPNENYTEAMVLAQLSRRLVDNKYTPTKKEYETIQKYFKANTRNFFVYGGGAYALSVVTINRFFKTTPLFRLRHVVGLLAMTVVSSTVNRTAKRSYLQDILSLDDSELAKETRSILEEIEGKDGPWITKYGPKKSSFSSETSFDDFGQDLPLDPVEVSPPRQRSGVSDWSRDDGFAGKDDTSRISPAQNGYEMRRDTRQSPGLSDLVGSQSSAFGDRDRNDAGLQQVTQAPRNTRGVQQAPSTMQGGDRLETFSLESWEDRDETKFVDGDENDRLSDFQSGDSGYGGRDYDDGAEAGRGLSSAAQRRAAERRERRQKRGRYGNGTNYEDGDSGNW